MKEDPIWQRIVEAHGGMPRESTDLYPNTVTLTNTTQTDIVAAPGGGYRTWLHSLTATNSSASVVTIKISNGMFTWKGVMKANGGQWRMNIPVPISAEPNEAWTAQLSASASSVYVTATAKKTTGVPFWNRYSASFDANEVELPFNDGTIVWDNINFGTGGQINASDDDRGEAVMLVNEIARVVVPAEFDFSIIPDTAIITGIELSVERSKTGLGTVKDTKCYLYSDADTLSGIYVGDNKADLTTEWPTTDTVKTYGGRADNWGVPLTPAYIKSVTCTYFGLGLACQATVDAATARIDEMITKIHWATRA